eukprot:TRINITY_DN1525_c0_g1_i1.p1 TRINITY_DN1525_c0_g1~~TRINITY_DN1525_c0_g1_i1.p1  ORF type:complete len:665 (-),score=256.94 TRINITY_DN1525_c0_g1_i1:84-2078(-)
MQFYSDYSSEEERDDYEIDLWNPNELIDEILAVEDENEKSKLKTALLQKFLDQERPLLTSKMKDFFLEDGVTESLIGFVSRLNINEDQKEAEKPVNESLRMRPLNPPGQEEDIKRSFNVMEMFINPMHDLGAFLPEKLHVILRELFKIFHPESKGNFYHFNKIMEQFLVRAPSATTKTLLAQNLLWQMLDYAHETPVVDTMIEIFCVGFPKQSETIQFYKALVDNKMFDRIGEKLYGKPSPLAAPIGEFFIRLMEKLSSIEMSGILFISLCRTSAFIDGLFAVLSQDDKYAEPQRLACANVLRELLLKSGQKVFEPMDLSKPLPNMLSAIHDKLHDYAKVHVVPLCNILIAMDARKSDEIYEFPSYNIKRPFGFYRLMLTDILSDLVVCAPEVLDILPPATWRVLSSWFLEYRFNNLYHFHFWKVYQLIIRDNHIESQKALFGKNKFLTRMIEQYKSPELSGNRGFIVVMCNTLRFAADLQASTDYLRHYLTSHDVWKGFLTQLRAETTLQQKRYDDLVFVSEDGEEEEDEGGIDLGSAYARSLGFDELPPVPQPAIESPKTTRKKKNKKKKKSKSASFSEISLEDKTASPTSPTSPRSPKETGDGKAEVNGQNLDWWKNMVDDFKEEEKHNNDDKEPTNVDDWWKELKSELQSEQSPVKEAQA